MHIYVLKLENEKYYIGRTNDLKNRVEVHYRGEGSLWTQKYRPTSTIEIIETDDPYDEDKVTLKYMEKYGIDNVRGGSFVRLVLSGYEKKSIQQMIYGNTDNCFRCGNSGHFAKECPSQSYTPWSVEEDEQLREEMREGLSVKEMSERHKRTPGAIRARMERVKEETPLTPLLNLVSLFARNLFRYYY